MAASKYLNKYTCLCGSGETDDIPNYDTSGFIFFFPSLIYLLYTYLLFLETPRVTN